MFSNLGNGTDDATFATPGGGTIDSRGERDADEFGENPRLYGILASSVLDRSTEIILSLWLDQEAPP